MTTPVMTYRWAEPESWTLATYERTDGYAALRTALTMEPDAIIAMVKDSGLRGRGGAGFPTGMKWGFIPQGDGKPHYLVVNADEGEPGTCKDAPLMMADPHSLIEGIIIASFAVRCHHAFIYLRGELVHAGRRLQAAIDEAYAAGYLGDDILGSGFDLKLTLHRGAGAYICGEETALLDSLEGYRGQPRLRPPFPATHGLYQSPTVVNNVESIATRAVDRAARASSGSGRWAPRSRPARRWYSISRPRRTARPVRGAARHDAAHAARHGRRHARRRASSRPGPRAVRAPRC